jgi:hypothetical protein
MKEVDIKPLFDLDDAGEDQFETMEKQNSPERESTTGSSAPATVRNGLIGQDILSVTQFDHEQLDHIFTRALEMRDVVERFGGVEILKGRVLACLFYEPSGLAAASSP